ncbi:MULTISPECIES: hypothetical protein [Prevotellaceae]|uniref:hypothetical protein n=1 Tax=Prevotellaceae TaxID=171552 RepID=UPI0003D3214D|nr:hypothetical protein [Prevotella phocaeensis]ETD21411.1 hypothetical protein HMPREF1199_00485 [Hoylesella oralis CC98A]
MKLRYKISIGVALALAGSLLWGGNVWLWLTGICVGNFLIRLLLTIALAITVYILTYALIMVALYAPILYKEWTQLERKLDFSYSPRS